MGARKALVILHIYISLKFFFYFPSSRNIFRWLNFNPQPTIELTTLSMMPLKTFLEKENIVVTRMISLFTNVFYPTVDLFHHLNRIKIVVCKSFRFKTSMRVFFFSFGKKLRSPHQKFCFLALFLKAQ